MRPTEAPLDRRNRKQEHVRVCEQEAAYGEHVEADDQQGRDDDPSMHGSITRIAASVPRRGD
eukprot:5023320-Alexandrium_andersonii.AAC.1